MHNISYIIDHINVSYKYIIYNICTVNICSNLSYGVLVHTYPLNVRISTYYIIMYDIVFV